MNEISASTDITAVILAGGRATRLGGVDKGLQPLAGKPLIEHVLARLHGQAGAILINCNRNPEQYANYGHPLVADLLPDFPGPLAGLHAALHTCTSTYLLTVPCDSPYLPRDLQARLRANLAEAPAVFAITPEQQPVFALYRRTLLPTLENFLAEGKRGVGQWLSHIGAHTADFSDCPEAFRNLNTADDWPGC
jgi:molybdenum cofactor guanylyltransferase